MFFLTSFDTKEGKLIGGELIKKIEYIQDNLLRVYTDYSLAKYSSGSPIVVKKMGLKGDSPGFNGTVDRVEKYNIPNSKTFMNRVYIKATGGTPGQVRQFCDDVKTDLKKEGYPV